MPERAAAESARTERIGSGMNFAAILIDDFCACRRPPGAGGMARKQIVVGHGFHGFQMGLFAAFRKLRHAVAQQACIAFPDALTVPARRSASARTGGGSSG